jgi:hypothetical protein
MKLFEEESLECWVCGKNHRRDSSEYYYFSGVLVCMTHDGAKEFYDGAVKLADEKLRKILPV